MSAYIKTLEDSSGNIIYPRTRADGIFTTNNQTLADFLANLITSGTEDLVEGASPLATGSIYLVYE